jgi:hypothetical protein
MIRLQQILVAGALICTAVVDEAGAQTIGTFRWQMRSYCNLLTLTITQVGGVYRVEGTDDECGAGRDRASVAGLAFPNPDGNIGMGLTIVTAEKGTPVHVTVEISLPGLSGTWRMPSGDTGAFVFTPGTPTVGYPRPLPPPHTGIPPAISLLPGGSLVAAVEGDSGIPASGPGTRMMWYAAKAAFRVGSVENDEWNDSKVGFQSTAMGFGTIASGAASTAFGNGTRALGSRSTALGTTTVASGSSSTALGSTTTAAGRSSLSGGELSTAYGDWALAFGYDSHANGDSSVALGRSALTIASAAGSFVFADSSSAAPFGSLGPNGFNVRAAGGFQFFTNSAASLGAALAPNATQWSVLSDVRTKHRFRTLDGEDTLTRIAGMPITEWSYKAQDPGIRHIGPTAQDFHAAFSLGEDPLRIGTLDADGVALAGVQALEARTRAMRDELAALRATVAALQAQLATATPR